MRRFNISDELYGLIEEQRLVACPNLTHQTKEYDDESILTLISIPTYQTQAVDSMLFCIDTGAPISCIGDKVLKKIIFQTGRTDMPIVKSERDFRFANTTMHSKGMVHVMLSTPEGYPDILILLDVFDGNILALLGLDVLDGNNLFVGDLTGHLWNRIVINRKLLRYNDRWKMKLIGKADHLYISLSELIQSFYTTVQ